MGGTEEVLHADGVHADGGGGCDLSDHVRGRGYDERRGGVRGVLVSGMRPRFV